jgi:hypothetical protein
MAVTISRVPIRGLASGLSMVIPSINGGFPKMGIGWLIFQGKSQSKILKWRIVPGVPPAIRKSPNRFFFSKLWLLKTHSLCEMIL